MERIKYQVRKGYQDNLHVVNLKKGCWQHRLQKRTRGLQTSISKGKNKVSTFGHFMLQLVMCHLGKILCTEMMDWMLQGKMRTRRLSH